MSIAAVDGINSSTAGDGPVTKRQKLSDPALSNSVNHRNRGSRIFAPFRTVGLVSPTDVAFTTLPLGKTTFQVTTSVGRSLQTYDLRRGLHLLFITRPQTPEIITATVTWKDQVLAAWGGSASDSTRGIWIFKRGKQVGQLELPIDSTQNVKQLLVFGAWIVACCSARIEVWKSTTLEHYTTLAAPFSRHGGQANDLTGGICNMPTYLNKVFAGRQDGTVEIWNVSTGKLLYTVLPAASDYGAVTALQPTPALSLLAVAYESGPVVIHDVRTDKEIIKLNTSGSGKIPVTSISFRTDGLGAGADGQKAGVMATASSKSGDIAFWDLNGGGRRMGVLRGAHNPPSSAHGRVAGGVSKVEFLAGQAVIVTSGLDNSLKSWIFDETPFSPIPRPLHTRGGHAAPVSNLQYLPPNADGADAEGKWLLSASKDRSLWGWSLRRDAQSTELSQGSVRKKAKKLGILSTGQAFMNSNTTLEDLKAPKITCMACSLNRDGGMGAVPGATTIWGKGGSGKASDAFESGMTGWESVVTGHEDDKFARTWFWGRKRAGRWAFETGDGTAVKSVAISPCGTFALVGSAVGGIDMFNLQSGMHRQRFPARLTPNQVKRLQAQQTEELANREVHDTPRKFARGQGKHTGAVIGLMVDSLNRTVISCGADGKVKFWEFATGLLLHDIDWYPMTTITGMRHHRTGDLIALSCDDSSIRVVDTETRKLVRELWGCKGTTIDFTFSNDGRWIIATSSDSIIRVWDLPTGHLIDAFKSQSNCTALAFSNTGEYLATAHEDTVGVHIWTNRTLFTHVPTRHISEKEIAETVAPAASGEGGQSFLAAAFEDDDAMEPQDDTDGDVAVPSVDQLSQDMLTLSLVPKSRWQNLLHLDLIRQRNKPKEPPKPPEKAPFFLPSLANALSTNNTPVTGGSTHALAPPPLAASSATEHSRITKAPKPDGGAPVNQLTTILDLATHTHDYTPITAYLSTLSPSAADIAIRSLSPAEPYTELISFITALTERLKAKRDYELVQAWMAVFLRVHAETVSEAEEVRAAVRAWREEQKREAGRLGKLVGYCGGVVGFLRSAR